MAMTIYMLCKESETDDINNPYVEVVELFENKEQAEQCARYLNSLLNSYDQYYNGWWVGEGMTVR